MHDGIEGVPLQAGLGRKDERLWAEAWRWRERLQRAIDGCATTDDMGAAGMAEYYELPGPNIPVTPGYSVRPPCLPGHWFHGRGLLLQHSSSAACKVCHDVQACPSTNGHF